MITYSRAKLIHLHYVPTTDVQQFQQLHLRFNLYTIYEHCECVTKYSFSIFRLACAATA